MGALTQALCQAEAQARSTLPVELHERLACAVSLVKDGRVFQDSAGTWQVDSASTEGLVYSVNGTCSCDDLHFNKPSQGLCKHRLAIFLSQRVLSLMQQAPALGGSGQTETTPALGSGGRTDTTPLPEAPASCNVYVMISGHKVQVTLRDTDEQRLLDRLQVLLDRYPVPWDAKGPTRPQGQLSPQQHNAAAMHRPVTDFCPVHNVQMRWNEGKEGRKGWYSHRTAEGQWCKGR